MKLYGIDKYNGTLESVEVVKETKKLYKIERGISWLGYRLQVYKDAARVFLTPQAAIENFISKQLEAISSAKNNIREAEEMIAKMKTLKSELPIPFNGEPVPYDTDDNVSQTELGLEEF